MARGNIFGVETGATFDASHCFEIASCGLNIRYFALAVEWLELGLEKAELEGLNKETKEEFENLLKEARTAVREIT